MDFSNYTLEQMDALDPEIIKHLEEGDYFSYLARNKELGRPYEVGGIQKILRRGNPCMLPDQKHWRKKMMAAGKLLYGCAAPDLRKIPVV